jgi:hypothetical protein
MLLAGIGAIGVVANVRGPSTFREEVATVPRYRNRPDLFPEGNAALLLAGPI